MQLMHWPRPLDPYVILHTVDKYDAGQQHHKCSYALKLPKDIGAKMLLYEFLSHIYIIW